MVQYAAETIAVIFIAQRTTHDEEGYSIAAQRMEDLAKLQPGYLGIDSVRNDGGLGITISYWRDDAAAKAWRDNIQHRKIRDRGRDRWYSHYNLHVAAITRSYDWAVS